MIDKLRKYNQQHLLNYAKDLSEEEYKNLIEEIEAIDFDLVTKLYKDTKNSAELLNADKGEITPLPCVDKASISKEEYNNYYNLGISLMKQGKYAALTMAGGQGTRLGYSGPKGSYFLGEPINKSLFQIQCQRLAARNKELGCIIPPTEKAMAPYSSTFAWKIPRMEEPGRLQFMGSLRVGHD